MSLSEAAKRSTREEWRRLGFYYEIQENPPCWRFVGSAAGLSRFVELLDEFIRDPRNAATSEHEHYGPYMYLKVETAESPEIDRESIRGSPLDLARLRDLIAAGICDRAAGDIVVIAHEYSNAVRFSLRLEVRGSAFDPSSADPALLEKAV